MISFRPDVDSGTVADVDYLGESFIMDIVEPPKSWASSDQTALVDRLKEHYRLGEFSSLLKGSCSLLALSLYLTSASLIFPFKSRVILRSQTLSIKFLVVREIFRKSAVLL